ncbi:PAS domain-containing sensor histidine kinase [Aestuariibaculum sediminum]|uniref:histidine kinase n=1 Tax=Aestuariibaculum sediminum TaxID=2770637 RepID=A0A8J6U8Z8_9FLAO|nr:PAS domain-containing sensor histidine kinase [Aestuariibaculum sediminum]MBD0833610.1 PAS domain S-box protein [Aestuariibaculum sediminum]
MNYLEKELNNLIQIDSNIFHFIQNNSLDGMWYWDLESPEHEWMNEKFWETLGYDPKDMPHTPSAWQDIINPDDLEIAKTNMYKHLKDPNYPYDQIVRYTHKQGRIIWIRCKGLAIRDKDGKPIRMLGSHIDVTSLKENEEYLQHCNKEANIGYWEVDVNTKKITWSDHTRKIHGVDNNFEPNIDTAIAFYKKGKHRDRITTLVENAMNNGERFTEELKIITAHGEEKWIKVLGIPERTNNSFSRIYGTIQDIQKRKESEIQLQRSEQAFRGNFENSAIGMAILNTEGQWLKVNKALCDIIGYTEEELKKLTFQDITHPDDLDLDLALLQEVIDGKRDHYHMEKRYFHKNRKIVYIQLSVSVVRKNNKEVLHFISQITDITQLKKQEQQLKKIISITQDQNERLKNFAHIVSHNLRSHSSGISALLEILKEENPDYFQNEMIKLLELSSNNLLETIEDLSEIVKINLSSEDSLIKIALKPVINSQISAIKALAEKNNITINNTVSEDLSVYAIKAYLESIVLNFITNAIKYSSKDRDSYLNISAEKNKNFTIITFEDNGLGINLDQHKNKLFGMYKTFHKNPDAKGIGLFITKNQVEALGGKIDVFSEVNKGSTFKVYLKHEKN